MKKLLALLIFSVCAIFLGAQEWSEPVLIVQDDYLKGGFDMFIDSEGVIHGTWHGQYEEDPSQDKIFYSKSLDGGQTWETPTIID